MPKITDSLPQGIADELVLLRQQLDAQIPTKNLDRNLIIATWNIRAFGGLTEKWASSRQDSPKRDLHAMHCIAEIIRRFDVVAVQEVRGNLKALRHLLKLLGEHWGFILTDVTRGDAGNGERMVYLFDTRKVQLSGLACELVIPDDVLGDEGTSGLTKQFARTPYAVGFKSAGRTFVLITLHVLYGDTADDRTPELKAIAEWLREWAKSTHSFNQNLIVLGDFNIDRQGDERYQAFKSTGLYTPPEIAHKGRTIFNEVKLYDHIAWFKDATGVPPLPMQYLKGDTFDFTQHALASRNLSKSQLSWMVSDHYPLWAEFATGN